MLKTRFLNAVVTLVSVSAVAAYATFPEGGPDDSHLCYKAKSGTPKFSSLASVNVSDAFDGATTAKVVKSGLICNAADYAGAGIIDNVTHLAAYKIKSAIKHTPHLNLLISDSIGVVHVDTKKADLLLVPGSIGLGSNPTPPLFLSHNVDNYKCYTVKVTKGTSFSSQQVSLQDQFSGAPKLFEIKKPKHLCLPVDLNGSTIKNSAGYLMCYQAKAVRGQAAHVPQLDVRVGNTFAQLESLSTKKEDEVCFPSVSNATCGDNKVNQLSEECDGTSDLACPGECSDNCGCWRAHTLTLNSSQSRVEIRGVNPGAFAVGLDQSYSLSGLAGTITLNTGNQLASGQYEVSVPTATLPPLDINIPGLGSVGTACVFLQEDPDMPGSGIAGTGVLSCFGGSGSTELPSPNFYSHQDHCSQGLGGCDSGTAFASQCTPDWAPAEALLGPGKTHAGTGACVPASLTDAACTATDPRSGSTANSEDGVSPEVHTGACNSPSYSKQGGAPYNPGDTVIVINAAVELRSMGDPCTTPPGPDAINASGPITTGIATSTIMDAFPSMGGTGKVQALVLTGSPLACVMNPPLHGDPVMSTSGASFVIAVSALDLPVPLLGAADLNAGLVLKAQ